MVYSIRLTLNFFFCSFLKHYFLAVRFGLRLQNFVHFSNYSYSGSWFGFSSMILLYCLYLSCQLSAYMSSWVVLWAWPHLLGSQSYMKFDFNDKIYSLFSSDKKLEWICLFFAFIADEFFTFVFTVFLVDLV